MFRQRIQRNRYVGGETFDVNGGTKFATPDNFDVQASGQNKHNFDIFGIQGNDSSKDSPILYCHVGYLNPFAKCCIRGHYKLFETYLNKYEKESKSKQIKKIKIEKNDNNNNSNSNNKQDNDIEMKGLINQLKNTNNPYIFPSLNGDENKENENKENETPQNMDTILQNLQESGIKNVNDLNTLFNENDNSNNNSDNDNTNDNTNDNSMTGNDNDENTTESKENENNNNNKQQRKDLVNVGDYLDIPLIDQGYNMEALIEWINKETQSYFAKPVLLTPLQIACAQYIAPTSHGGKYTKMIPQLVYYGADIHHASLLYLKLTENEKEDKETMLKMIQEEEKTVKQTTSVLDKYDTIDWSKRGLSINDQKHRLYIIRTKENLQDKLETSKRKLIEMKKEYSVLMKRFEPIIVNDSPYVIALKLRRTCNDNGIIEAIIEGANLLKDLVFENVFDEDFDEPLAQLVVEFMIGLPLNIWEA